MSRLQSMRWSSLLFLPATSPALLAKATQRGADALIVDLEDSVPIDRKAQARSLAALAIADLAGRGASVLLRVNADPSLLADDLAAVPLHLLSALMLPKVQTPAQLARLSGLLQGLGSASLPVAALIESPAGVLAARDIAACDGLCALGFGAEDYAAALDVPAEPVALTWPAQQVITCAHAFGLQCWGLAASIAVVDDEALFAESVRHARAIGFTGSVCIHPRQVAIVNSGFAPSAAELAWAAKVVAADDAARLAGQGAALLDGRMIDRPIVERARRWLRAGGSPTVDEA